MSSYYNKHEGDLFPGHIAKSSDINAIQQGVEDALRNLVSDLTEDQSWIIGGDENAFLLTPESKRAGRYIDQMNLAEDTDSAILSIRRTSYRQPIKLARSSVYSVIVKMQNKSEIDVPVTFELRNESGDLIPNMKTVATIPKNTNTPTEFEIIFDLDYYPTAHGMNPEELEKDNPQLVNPNTDEASFETGVSHDDESIKNTSAGASVIYLFIEALNVNKQKAFDINGENSDGTKWNDTDPTFGIVINKNSQYGQLLEENNGSGFVASSTPGDLYFKEIYANAPTYHCEMGQAIIHGEKVVLADTHVSIGGANSAGNVISYVYMDTSGHLKAINSKPFVGDEPSDPIPVQDDHLHIANIITYENDVKDPVIEQSDETQETRPRSHHERIRRLEKKLSYTQDIAIPPRFKYTLTGEDWIDPNPAVDLSTKSFDGLVAQTLDALDKKGYTLTTDANGNFIVKVSEAESFKIPITLKSQTSGKVTTEKDKTKVISSAQTTTYINKLTSDDISRAQTFAEIKNMKNDVTNGKLTLESTSKGTYIATTDKEAKETEFNPWDDSKQNRPKSANIKPTTRSYSVVSGKNGANDWASEFPAMTFYTDTGYKLKKLQIPIYKFKNCEGIKFIIWERQGPNNKTNTVWFKQRMFTSKTFSLKNAKVKKGYQYMEDGFLIDFGKNGLKLSKGQYVIVCIPIVKSGTGTVYVDTYKPKNPKDFCIRYHGAANASHFLLKDRYQEIWYNSAKAVGEVITYSKEGSITSGTVSWKNKEAIKSVKVLANLTTPDKTKATISVDVGGGWIAIKPGETKNVTGSGTGESFRWKIEFKGNSKETPTLSYDKNKKYALSFEITRMEPSTSNLSSYRTLDRNLCLTSKVFDANTILRQYLGDMNFALSDNKFSNYEFARVWGSDSSDKKLCIDICGSDRMDMVKDGDGHNMTNSDGQQLYFPVYSFHYVDLSLDDFSHSSVDYSNYDASLEDDEYNLRLKLDTDNSYNDDNIRVINYTDFELANSAYAPTTNTNTTQTDSNDSNNNSNDNSNNNSNDNSNNNSNEEEEELKKESIKIDLSKVTITKDKNQLLAKAKLNNPIDLSKYAGLKMGLALSGQVGGTVSGLAIYISSQNEVDVPSRSNNEDLLSALPDGLPDLNSAQEDVISTYANQIVVDTYNSNGTAVDVYYKSVWNSADQKWEWQQVHDVKSYNIYDLINRSDKTNTLKITKDDKEEFYEIDIDADDLNLKSVKEIGLIILNDENKYSRTNVNVVKITDFCAIKKDYYAAFKAADGHLFKKAESRSPVTCLATGNFAIHKSGGSGTYKKTVPDTSSIAITHQSVLDAGETLCVFDMTSKDTKGFNHIGIQLAADCIIVKNMLELHLRKKNKNGTKTTIEKVKIPTINYIYYSTEANNIINLSQIFKKLKTTEKFDEIAIVATSRFKKYANQLKGNLGNTITLYVGNIVLYRANTIPLFHPYMRMKFYLDETDNISRDEIGIRKIGAVLDYQ